MANRGTDSPERPHFSLNQNLLHMQKEGNGILRNTNEAACLNMLSQIDGIQVPSDFTGVQKKHFFF